jgi:coiled-coil domain-containing protein 55
LAHKKRELEKLLVEERKFKKERASEGTEFDDKEAFVTGAYKQQIEERNKFREEIEKQDYIDCMWLKKGLKIDFGPKNGFKVYF